MTSLTYYLSTCLPWHLYQQVRARVLPMMPHALSIVPNAEVSLEIHSAAARLE